MKNLFAIFLLIAALTGCDSSAIKNDGDDLTLLPDENSFQVKVVATLCGYAILEIVDPQYYEYGINWVDGSGKLYEHVFGTVFPCFTEAKSGETITIQLIEEQEPGDCARCEAYLETPDKKYFVKVIK